MSYIVDTCGWIEWLIDSDLAPSYAHYFKNLSDILVPTLIQYELYKWVTREKNSIAALEVIGITETGTVIPLDTNLALYAADIAKEYKLAMADAIIYATSKHYKATLITSDKHFLSLPDIQFIKK